MLSPLHHSASFTSFRAGPSAGQSEQSQKNPEVSADGDKGAAKPVGETESKKAPKEASRADQSRPKGSDGEPLDDSEMKIVSELQHRDREVRNHEMAHVAAGGQYVRGGPTYSYQTGPDGKRYAVGGEVSISTGKESTPEKSIAKAKVVRRAALAPAQPSGQDRAVAAAASKMEQSARVELREKKLKETTEARKEREAQAEEAQAAQEAAKGDGAEEVELMGEAGAEAEEPNAQFQVGRPKGLAPRPNHIPTAYSNAGGGPAGRSAGGGGGGGLLNLIA